AVVLKHRLGWGGERRAGFGAPRSGSRGVAGGRLPSLVRPRAQGSAGCRSRSSVVCSTAGLGGDGVPDADVLQPLAVRFALLAVAGEGVDRRALEGDLDPAFGSLDRAQRDRALGGGAGGDEQRRPGLEAGAGADEFAVL